MSALPVARASLPAPRTGTSRLLLVEIRDIVPATGSPRTDPGDISALAASIAEFGLLEPVQVQRCPNGQWVLWPGAGLRRLAALRALGRTQVEAIIRREATAERMVAASLSMDAHRRAFDEYEQVTGYRRLRALGRSNGDIARLVGQHDGDIEHQLADMSAERARVAAAMAQVQTRLEMTRKATKDRVERDARSRGLIDASGQRLSRGGSSAVISDAMQQGHSERSGAGGDPFSVLIRAARADGGLLDAAASALSAAREVVEKFCFDPDELSQASASLDSAAEELAVLRRAQRTQDRALASAKASYDAEPGLLHDQLAAASELEVEAVKKELSVTDRQLRICRLVAAGRSNTEIAQEMGVSTDIVKTDLRRLGITFGNPDRTAIVVHLMRRRLID